MCTCLDFKAKDYYFGRNLDLEYNFNEKVVITPRNYEFNLKNGTSFNTKSAIIGMATVIDEYPLYAEASNEDGLSIAGLNFPGNACYFNPKEDYINIAVFELIPWILGSFKTVDELMPYLNKLNITNITYNESMPTGELHWIISDQNKCIVLEQMNDGLHIYDNKFGVLTNNPPFSYHEMNMVNYINLSPNYPFNRVSDKIELKPYAQGIGAFGLPGDCSPTSRFVKTVFNKYNAEKSDNDLENVGQFFHILDSVSFISGCVITKENKYDKTMYSSCINVTKGIYYYKTYNNNQISAISLNEDNKNSSKLTIIELIKEQNINYIN